MKRQKKPSKPSKLVAFLEEYRESGSVTLAAKRAGISRNAHYKRLKQDRAYAKVFHACRDQAGASLEDEAIRRATRGVLEPVFYQGNRCGYIRRYSDGLLQFLLKGALPEKYRERSSVEHSGPAGGPIEFTDATLAQLSDTELECLIGVARKLQDTADAGGGTAPPAAEQV
ncbi:MAG TPA: hypothetical protein VFA33_07480 [Bryobacteraceae bacterium]|nr:hypothetical protein [Bryobacteraceae bacterium]